jgi:hypothetical protein
MKKERRTNASRKAGLSLREVIVVVGIMTMVLFMVTEIFRLNYVIYQSQSRRSENETGAVLAANAISKITRGASEVEASHVFGGDTQTTSSTVLVLKTPSIDSSDNIIPGSYDHIAFYRHATETTKIFSVVDADPASARVDSDRMITDNNQRLFFRYDDPSPAAARRISVFVQNQQTSRGTTLTTRGWTSIFLRNTQ